MAGVTSTHLSEDTLPNTPRSGSRTLTLDTLVEREPVPGIRVLERVARGATSSVYRAHHTRLGIPLALKVLDERHLEDDGIKERLDREARVLAGLRHDGVVRLLDRFTLPDGRPVLALEWLEGRDLEQVLRGGPLAEQESLRIAHDVARALAHVHARGVLHRDLKPANLFLVGEERRPVLLDFGVARTETAWSDTATGGVLGTPAYMAPEQVADASRVDVRADVYALGAVLFRMLSGDTPYPRDEPLRTLRRVETEAPRALGTLVQVAPTTEALVMRCLARDPTLRPPSAAALADELAASLRALGLDVDAPEVPRTSRIGTVALGLVTATALTVAVLADRAPLAGVVSLVVGAFAALALFGVHDKGARRFASGDAARSPFVDTLASGLFRGACAFTLYAFVRESLLLADGPILARVGGFYAFAVAVTAETTTYLGWLQSTPTSSEVPTASGGN